MVRNIFFLPILMKKRTVQKQIQSSVYVDEQAKTDGLTSQAPRSRRKRMRNEIENTDGMGKKQKDLVNRTDQEVKPDDRISELPESMIHHILSFLRSSKEAARTSILSKRWRVAWKSFSVLTVDHRFLRTETNLNMTETALDTTESNLDWYQKYQMLIDTVANSLQSHLEQKLGIYKLVLRINPELALSLNSWVIVALKEGVKELDLHIEKKPLRFYTLPPLMHSAQCLIGLRLHGCNWSNFQEIKFCNLQKLYFRSVRVNQEMIQNLISSCPLLMDLRMVECRGLKILQISSSPKLDRVELHNCHGLRKIELEVDNLHTFWYSTRKSARCKINLGSCKSLKRLTLSDPNLTDALLENQLSNFPSLEQLDLNRCDKLRCVMVLNQQLRSLAVRSCRNLKLTSINSPWLSSLNYKGSMMPFLLLTRLCLAEGKFSFKSTKKDIGGTPLRNHIIKTFLQKHYEGLKIVIGSKKNFIIYEDSKEINLPVAPDLNVQVVKSSTDSKDLLDSLLRTWHPKSLTIVSSPHSRLPKMVHEIHREEDPRCCRFNASNNKCWRHFLINAKVAKARELPSVLLGDLNLSDMEVKITSIRLYWKPFERPCKP